MLKYLLIPINLIGLIGIRILFPGGISIQSDMPEYAEPGDEIVVTITVSKDDLSGFAKFTQELPEGFSASLVTGADATFSFKDQTIKYIWVALPPDGEFSFSYRLSVSPDLSGTFEIGGSFSYIFDNEKQSADLPLKEIKIGGGLAGVKKTVKGQVQEKITGVQCRRTTAPMPGLVNTFKVELRIDKPDISGFAKVEESIPEGFFASELESQGGIFSFKNQLMKVIWMSIPASDQYIISYKLTTQENVSGNQKISGAFSYLKGDESLKYFIAPSTIFIEKSPGDEIPTIIIADEGGDFKEHEKEVAVTEKKAEPKKAEPVKAPVTSIPEPQADVSYRVQVAAGHQPVNNNYFAKKFNLTTDINIENHQGWIKYTFGSFNVYKDCRDRRNRVWNENEIRDAFVTAYNAGTRITVQEALMITNQKWYN